MYISYWNDDGVLRDNGIHLVRTLGAVLPDEPCILVDPVSAEDKDCLETVFHVPAIKLDND